MNSLKMKFLLSFFVLVSVVMTSKELRAKELLPVKKGVDIRIETIDNHAFFVLNLETESIGADRGDEVVLIFGLNKRIKVYNVSSEKNNAFSNEQELVVFISPKDLRCFEKKTLRKIIIYTESKPVVIKTNIGPDQLKIN